MFTRRQMTVRLASITCSGDFLPLSSGPTACGRTPSPRFRSHNISCLRRCTFPFWGRFLIVVVLVFVRVTWHYSIIIVLSEATGSGTVDALQSSISFCDTGKAPANWTDSAMFDMILSWSSGVVVELTHFEHVETDYERTARPHASLSPWPE